MKPIIIVAGVRASGDGYPNADCTLLALETAGVADVVDVGERLPANTHLWKVAQSGWMRRAKVLGMIVAGTLRSLMRALRAARMARGRSAVIYVAYPAVPTLLLMRFLPRRWCLPCVADAYISLWDSAFNDRRRSTEQGLASRMTRYLERAALRGAWRVLVDTEANREFLVESLGLEDSSVVSMPLATPLAVQEHKDGRAKEGMRVLFFGTFIPLHGIDIVLEAATLLRGRSDIHFELVGDGQEADRLMERSETLHASNITWTRSWLPMSDMAARISAADVCLGVFGGKGKAARVLPFKIYHSLAAGKAIVTQAAMSLPEGVPPPPCDFVHVANRHAMSRALADSLIALAESPERRRSLGANAAAYFDTHLSLSSIADRWRALLFQR